MLLPERQAECGSYQSFLSIDRTSVLFTKRLAAKFRSSETMRAIRENRNFRKKLVVMFNKMPLDFFLINYH